MKINLEIISHKFNIFNFYYILNSINEDIFLIYFIPIAILLDFLL